MFSLLYYPGILPRGYWIVNRFLQEIFNIFCKNLLFWWYQVMTPGLAGGHDFLKGGEILMLIELGEGALVRTVHKTVEDRTYQTTDHEYHPDQTVVVGGGDQQKTDQILGAG